MIVMENWRVLMKTRRNEEIGYAGENSVARLEIKLIGEYNQSWIWTLEVLQGKYKNVILLSRTEDMLWVDILSDYGLPQGMLLSQIVAKNVSGDVKKSNIFYLDVSNSLCVPSLYTSGVPSAMEQALDQIKELNACPPYPGENGYWMVWDLNTHAYMESQLPLPAGGGGGTGDYNALDNLPSINGVTIKGALSVADLGIPDLSASVEAAQGAAQAAAEGARAAQGAAQSAEERAQDAQTAKGFAEEAKSEAEISAQQAQKSAAQADESAAAAQGHANTAQGAVTAAQASAEKAAASAEEAKGVVPPTDGVPQNYVLTPAGWVAPSGGMGSSICQVWDVTVEEDVISYTIPIEDPTSYDYYIYQVSRPDGWSGNLLFKFVRGSDKKVTTDFQIAKHKLDGGLIIVRPIDKLPFSMSINYSNTAALNSISTNGTWYNADGNPASIIVKNSAGNVEAGTRILLRGYKFESI